MLIAVFSGFAPQLLGGGDAGPGRVHPDRASPCWACRTARPPAPSPPTSRASCRYTGAALTSDLAWLIGAAFAPLVALGLCSQFGLAWLGAYLLSGAIGTLAALGINRAMNYKS